MTTRMTRATIAIVIGATATLASGCAAVAGSGSADTAEVAAYQSTIAQSRAAAAAAAKNAACTAWKAAYPPRNAATRATTDFTRTPGWDWNGIAPIVQAELAAIDTEKGKLTSIVTLAEPAGSIHNQFTDYQSKLGAYGDALRSDFEARGNDDNTWPRSNPARRAMSDSGNALIDACGF